MIIFKNIYGFIQLFLEKLQRVLFFFLSILFSIIVKIRNLLYDFKIFKSTQPNVFTIVVGNLMAGGTGKTPFVMYLIEYFEPNYKIVVLTRGYGRKTKENLWVNQNSSTKDVGDEPKEIFEKFNGRIPVFCAANRVKAIEQIKLKIPDVQLVILDDGFQHRSLKPHFSILLDSKLNPHLKSSMLPLGRKREPSGEVKRADVTFQTKTIDGVVSSNHDYSISTKIQDIILNQTSYNFVSGIVESNYLIEQLRSKGNQINQLFIYPDHHQYTLEDINLLLTENQFSYITTMKDFVKIKEIASPAQLDRFIPIHSYIVFLKGESEFLEKLTSKINSFYNLS